MPASQQSLAPSDTPAHRVLHVTLDTVRPNMSGPFASQDRPIGVSALVTEGDLRKPHWMAGYAKSDDMARAAMVHHLLQLPDYRGAILEVSSAGLRGILGDIPAARGRGGLKTSGKPFGAFDVFDPVEAALSGAAWRLEGPEYGAAFINRGGAATLAKGALEVATGLYAEFPSHRTEHPYWWMLRVGNTSNPLTERHEPS